MKIFGLAFIHGLLTYTFGAIFSLVLWIGINPSYFLGHGIGDSDVVLVYLPGVLAVFCSAKLLSKVVRLEERDVRWVAVSYFVIFMVFALSKLFALLTKDQGVFSWQPTIITAIFCICTWLFLKPRKGQDLNPI